MRTYLFGLVMLASLASCKKDAAPAGAGAGVVAHSTKDADALWALAPEGAKFGFVVTPRAMDLFESGALTFQQLVQQAPELAMLKEKLDAAFTEKLGGPFTSFAALGLDKTRGLAVFADADGEPVVTLPIADRTKVAAWTKAPLGDDPAKLGPLACKPINNVSVCAANAATLAKIGGAKVPAAITAIGARGDLEGFGADGPISGAGVLQLERGELVARGSVTGLPPMVTAKLGAPNKPRVDAHSAAFAVASIAPIVDLVPRAAPLPGGGTVGELLDTVNGPITITIGAGSIIPDVRIPVKDPAPAKRLVDNCKDFIPAPMLAADQQPGVCKFNVPQYAMSLELWVDDKEIHLGAKQAPALKTIALTPLGKELSAGTWALAFWGRGTMFGSTGFPGFTADLPAEGAMMIRGLSLLSEMGIAVRVEQSTLSAVVGFRTIFANPETVSKQLLAIPPADIAGGKVDGAQGVAKGAPTSPFAGDLVAGQGGLMVPTAVVGMLAAVAIPAFMDYMKKSKKTEAALQLNRIAKNLKVYAITNAALPVGEVVVPPTSCCEGPGAKCPANPADFDAAIWKALEFSLDEPHLFRYGYKSDGKTATVTAVGDLDCDGVEITFALQGTLGADGELTSTIVEPARNTD